MEVKNPGTLRVDGIHMYVDSIVPFGPSDKAAGRIGNKGTSAKIIPDDQMPKVWDVFSKKYLPADIVQSPISMGKRSNIGIIKETNQTFDKSKPIILPDGKTVKGAHKGKERAFG